MGDYVPIPLFIFESKFNLRKTTSVPLAQLVEPLPHKRAVTGSSPVRYIVIGNAKP